ncbi:hypothetical protein OHA72_42705 [Dactylosporangium sp. NBC_01737]|uniref:hypothetical protein n=1 Tax=Dactylosporangium sp. NBC_01737 TaxID=2975959 RepID=UPI002E13F499|nr:hypothetical protein OHA72_42705 [Dactylosporangium sp. NBC_01737]
MDISAGLVRRMVWLIQRTLEQEHTVAQVRRRAAQPPVDVDTALDANLLRTAAWLLTLLLTVPVVFVYSLVDGLLPDTAADVGWTVIMGLLAGCALLGVGHAVRAAITGKTDDEQWAARRRWIAPGNVDVVVVLLVVLAGIVVSRL